MDLALRSILIEMLTDYHYTIDWISVCNSIKKDPKGLNGALAYTYTILMLTRIFMELF